MEYRKILNEVLRYIKPTKEERRLIEKVSKEALNVASEEALNFGGRAMLVGSLTRDTWLPSKREFDIFILLPEELSEKELEKIGLEIGKKVFERLEGKWRIEYAQHPYVSGEIEGINVDVVPCFAVSSPQRIRSAVDRTPFHVKYIEKKLHPSLSDEVRLLKQFLAANDMYGADAKTQGFSGYICELLVVEYGSFLKVLENATKWEPGEIIDIEKYYPEKDYKKLRRKFKGQVLIVIDPTDKNRNVAAALSTQNFFKFKLLAKEFLNSPSGKFFFKKELRPLSEVELIRLLLKRRTEIILVKFKPPDVVPDILWPQLRRLATRLERILEEKKYEFRVLGKDVYTNEKDLAIVLLEMEVSKLPFVQKRVGPPVFNLENSKEFLSKYSNQAIAGPYIEDDAWCVEVERKFTTARDKLIDSLNKPLEILKAKGIPNYLAEQIAKEFEVISETKKIIELIEKDREFGIFLRKYFEKEKLI